MKVFVNQCPLCEANAPTNYRGDYPQPCICKACGGVSIALSDTTARAMTLLEVAAARKQYPRAPKSVQRIHDRAVANMWG